MAQLGMTQGLSKKKNFYDQHLPSSKASRMMTAFLQEKWDKKTCLTHLKNHHKKRVTSKSK